LTIALQYIKLMPDGHLEQINEKQLNLFTQAVKDRPKQK